MPFGDHMLVVDNQELLKSWLRLALHEIYGYRVHSTPIPGPAGHFDPHIITGPQPGGGAPEPYQPMPLYPGGFVQPGSGGNPVQFCEHINFDGEAIYLDRGKAYNNLLKVRMGLFGTENWNDEISSVRFGGYYFMALLYEDIYFQGQTLTVSSNESNLHRLGWGDRASSIETY